MTPAMIFLLYGAILIVTNIIGIKVFTKVFGTLDQNINLAIKISGVLGIFVGACSIIASIVLAIFPTGPQF